MKKPKKYTPELNRQDTQKAFFDYLFYLEKHISKKINSQRINTIIFKELKQDETDLEDASGRNINFDSISDFAIYNLLQTYRKFFHTDFKDINNFEFVNDVLSFYTINDVLERDLEVDDITKIQSKIISYLILTKDKEFGKKAILKKIYESVFHSFNDLKEDFKVDIDLPRKINFFYEEKETQSTRFFSTDLIKRDLLTKEGIIIWVGNNSEFFQILSLSKVNSEILEIMTLREINDDFKTHKDAEKSDKYTLEINFSNLLTFLLNKHSKSELLFK